MKYLPYDSRPTEILQRVHPIWENFPTMEESRENYIRDCKADLDIKDTYRAANYYSIVTLLNPEVNSAEDFPKCMVEEMVKDGITPGRMNKNKDKTRDPEMHQTKKGNQWYFGMKIHSGADAGTGYVHTITSTAANTHDIVETHHLVREDDHTVYADSGYLGIEKRDEIDFCLAMG